MKKNKNTEYILRHYNIKDIMESYVGKVHRVYALTDGEFNAAFKLVCEKKNYLLKVAPPQETDVLSYESGLMSNEYNLLKAIAEKSKVKVPNVYRKDFTRRELDTDFLLLEFFDDCLPYNKYCKKMTKVERGNLMFELGQEVARLHQIHGLASFGYTHQKQHTNWRDTFMFMFNQVIDDIRKQNIRVFAGDKITHYIQKNIKELDAVKEPTLTHFDIWGGNVFVNIKTHRLHGIVDPERGFYGDPLGDFISIDLLSSIEKNSKFLDGYRNVRHIDFSENDRIRMNMLRLYLALVMMAESPLRYGKNSFKAITRNWVCKKIIKKVLAGKY